MRTPVHRCFLSIVAVCILVGAVGGCAPGAERTAEFTVVLLPDTQYYSDEFPETYLTQTRWIKRQAKVDNIRFVIHLGDIVQNSGVERQWKVADAAHRILDGAVPYSMVPGNHDMDVKNGQRVRNTRLYNKYFPPSRFEKYPWYGGHKDETNTNNYCFFEGGGMKFMVLSLEFAPADETLKWADKIVRAHPDRQVIVATHYHLRGKGRSKDPGPYGLDGSVGEKLWSKFLHKHANIFMAVCGHVAAVHHQTAVNDAGGKVHEILCDYQNKEKGAGGGNGWLQRLRFVPTENRIYVEAYSPLLDKYNKDPKHTYTLEYDMRPSKLKKAG